MRQFCTRTRIRVRICTLIVPALLIALTAIADGTSNVGAQTPPLTCNCLNPTIIAAGVITCTSVPDVIVGSAGNDVISGLSGNDTIYGEGGDDVIDAGSGDDQMWG